MRFLMIPRPLPPGAKVGKTLGSCDQRHPEFKPNAIKALMHYNEEMAKAGVLIAAEGINPVEPAVQVTVADGERIVYDGPFVETKELTGGFYVIEVASKDEAIRWALRSPVTLGHEVLELRRLTDLADLPADFQAMIRTEAPTWSAATWNAQNPKAQNSQAGG